MKPWQENKEKLVLDLIMLHRGKSNPIRDKEIRKSIFVADTNERKPTSGLREIINSLRQKRHPICSGLRGYWYAETIEELEENIHALEGRARKIFEATEGMRQCLELWVQKENEQIPF